LHEYYLFLHKADGVPLWQVGELAAWQAAARWAAAAHAKLAVMAGAPKIEPLVPYSEEFYRRWPARVNEFVLNRLPAGETKRALQRVIAGYDRVVDRLVPLPRTMIHGEFCASNIVADVSDGTDRPVICPVDWEMAGVGPGLMDLADLASGNWSEPQRRAMAEAYLAALPPELAPPPAEFDAALDACRLHKTMQWLGWSADWQPPEQHRHDWLGEALRLGEKLGLS
jgi:aminoglycoside phosphotransferase (APT) family kinase protein